jgi:hypothetical protein
MSPPASNSTRAPVPHTGMGGMPPVSTSAEALVVALALEVAVELADALADAVELALAGISGQTPSGSNAVWSFVPNSTFPSALK